MFLMKKWKRMNLLGQKERKENVREDKEKNEDGKIGRPGVLFK